MPETLCSSFSGKLYSRQVILSVIHRRQISVQKVKLLCNCFNTKFAININRFKKNRGGVRKVST